MKKNIIAGIVAALVVSTGSGAIAYNVGHKTAAEKAAITNAIEMDALYDESNNIITDHMSDTREAFEKLTKMQHKLVSENIAVRNTNKEKAALENKIKEDKAAREKAEAEKKATEEQAKKDAEARANAAYAAAKTGITDAIKYELANKAVEGRLTEDSINYIKSLLKVTESQGYHLKYTQDEIRAMNLDVADAVLLGLQIA